MQYFITWDHTGEHLWNTTPYKNRKLFKWEAEHTTPENKIKIKDGTMETYCWDCVNAAFPINVFKLTKVQYNEILKHAIT